MELQRLITFAHARIDDDLFATLSPESVGVIASIHASQAVPRSAADALKMELLQKLYESLGRRSPDAGYGLYDTLTGVPPAPLDAATVERKMIWAANRGYVPFVEEFRFLKHLLSHYGELGSGLDAVSARWEGGVTVTEAEKVEVLHEATKRLIDLASKRGCIGPFERYHTQYFEEETEVLASVADTPWRFEWEAPFLLAMYSKAETRQRLFHTVLQDRRVALMLRTLWSKDPDLFTRPYRNIVPPAETTHAVEEFGRSIRFCYYAMITDASVLRLLDEDLRQQMVFNATYSTTGPSPRFAQLYVKLRSALGVHVLPSLVWVRSPARRKTWGPTYHGVYPVGVKIGASALRMGAYRRAVDGYLPRVKPTLPWLCMAWAVPYLNSGWMEGHEPSPLIAREVLRVEKQAKRAREEATTEAHEA